MLELANLTPMNKMVECVRSRLLENLRMLPHAPGVQMADIPEDSLDINQDELRDAANPDTRVTSIMKVGIFSHFSQCVGSHFSQCFGSHFSQCFGSALVSMRIRIQIQGFHELNIQLKKNSLQFSDP
jgi:hypothetical protein